MDLKEIINKRDALEKQVTQMLNDFVKETGVNVDGYVDEITHSQVGDKVTSIYKFKILINA